jgi:hypothetical protein
VAMRDGDVAPVALSPTDPEQLNNGPLTILPLHQLEDLSASLQVVQHKHMFAYRSDAKRLVSDVPGQ